ncbi:MAG: RHS repeat-associated core domain-containing protein [Thermoguttaceae bacterium]
MDATPFVPTALVEFDYTYDKAGNLLTATENQSASTATGLSGVTTDAYDALNRLVQTKQSVGGVVNKRANFVYNADGSTQSITRYSDDGTTTVATSNNYTYDGIGRLTSLTHTPTGGTAITYGWTYDAASRVTGMTNSAHADETINNATYDVYDQLTGVDYSGLNDEGYTYDDNGNRTNTGYTTGVGNRLMSDGTYNYTYDGEGNRTARFVSVDGTLNAGDTDITTYEWDYRNRLTKVSHFTTYANYQSSTTDSVVEYTYDYLDRRIERKIDADGSGEGAADYYYNVYQGDNAALEIHDANGLSTAGTGENAPHVEHRYLYGQAVDEILASEDSSGTVLWGLGDHEGTIRDIVNNARTVVDHRQYDSFGNITSESVPTTTDFIFGYTGQALDDVTGLMDYGHRWYDAAVGRFASEDPSGFDAGDMNLYRYVNNNPLNNTDPTGLCGIHSTFESYPGASALLSSVGSSYKVASSGVSYDLFGNPIQRYGSSSSSSHSAATIGGSTGLSSTFKSPVVSSPISSSLASYSGATIGNIPGVSNFTLTSGAVTQGVSATPGSVGVSWAPLGSSPIATYINQTDKATLQANAAAAQQRLSQPTIQADTQTDYEHYMGSLLSTARDTSQSPLARAAAVDTYLKTNFTNTASSGEYVAYQVFGPTNFTPGIGSTSNFELAVTTIAGAQAALRAPSANGPIIGGGAQLENLSAAEQARMQAFANRYGTDVTNVGSRAGGTASPMSDFDYIISGNSRLRANARAQLPRGAAGGEIGPRGETGIDIFNGNKVPLDPTRPHIIFRPTPKQGK